jgi:hypothetical protein
VEEPHRPSLGNAKKSPFLQDLACILADSQ